MDGLTLLDPFNVSVEQNFSVKGLSLDSRTLKAGEVFFAYPGENQDGRTFIDKALIKRPSAVLLEAAGHQSFINPTSDVPCIPIHQLQEKVGKIASHYYDHPSSQMHVVGVTGTNGKTSVSHFTYQALTYLGVRAAYMGTLGLEYSGFQSKPNLTTPDPIALQSALKHLQNQGIDHVVLEVSSHALEQHRVAGVCFDQAAFTNLTPEHLDYHKTFEAYGLAKQKLFKWPNLKGVVLNVDDPFGIQLTSRVDPKCPQLMFSTQSMGDDPRLQHKEGIYVKSYTCHTTGLEADLQTPWGKGGLQSKLIGRFNLSNILATVSILCQQGFPLEDVLQVVQKIQPVPGRMENFGGANFPQVIVDFAHTPDALQNALEAARAICKRRLWVVFGCGGNRDTLKRQEMGKVASQFADKIVITNDNPRDESPKNIIQDILKGVDEAERHKVVLEENRKQAIAHAIKHALTVDVILVAGKGHEAYQIVGNQKLPHCDKAWVQEILGR